MDKEQFQKSLFDLLSFLIISARNLVEEPKLYGPLRLIDGASRLIEILEKEGLSDEFLSKIRKKIEEKENSVMTNKDEFIELLDDLTLDFADELKKRSRTKL
jgi:hypothetical protein